MVGRPPDLSGGRREEECVRAAVGLGSFFNDSVIRHFSVISSSSSELAELYAHEYFFNRLFLPGNGMGQCHPDGTRYPFLVRTVPPATYVSPGFRLLTDHYD